MGASLQAHPSPAVCLSVPADLGLISIRPLGLSSPDFELARSPSRGAQMGREASEPRLEIGE